MGGGASEVRAAALLTALRTRGETVAEVVSTVRALRAHADRAPLPLAGCVDTCGTGGDGAGTFNISTIAAFVAAGAGAPVAKHGNRAASSRCGSADVLEALGVEVDLPVEAAARLAKDVGIAFFFARRAHPALRHLAAVRAELGFRTIVNAAAPLCSPVGTRRQLLGVYEPRLVELLARALAELGAERALVVHGSDGLDEITTTGTTRTAFWDGTRLSLDELDPASLGIPRARLEDLAGGDAEHNAAIARAVLGGEKGAARDVVVLNASAALFVADVAGSLAEGVERAAASLDSGAASAKLDALVAASRGPRR
jgi:anthranilate phosphoribosyltransferase